MTAPSGSCVLNCGFRKIESPEEYFKGSCFRRGIKLYASNHVYGVKEEILSETAPSGIVARCIPQMKSNCDYDVRPELENDLCRSTLFCTTAQTTVPENGTCTIPGVRCAFADMIACEGSNDENADPTRALTDAVDESLNLGVEVVRSLLGEVRETYSTMQVASTVPLKINRCNLLAMVEQREKTFYKTFVEKSVEELAEMALLTRDQPAADRLHQERKYRIRSTMAHRIKTRRQAFKALANALAAPRPFRAQATTYGRNAEAEANRELSMAIELPIHEVGLVVHQVQPWLCGSPDGLVITGETTRLVEVRCPFVLQDSMLIDYAKGISNIKFIQYVDDQLTLKSSHDYNTQLMVMLYVLNLTDALFFVYSKKQSITVEVKRNDKFLAEYIPKMECFYFTHLLKALGKK
ncbi:hypothetical protein HPB48_010815 [Haemaphysalis longicornis]|uniref:YqaJ viral recombinase domain-containing protein n=1 Tax=Haemaphysalis longicornis TaxID=44386 RepID=A0A9J6GW38_HAELO|nr:hypothetical protein HPB48_010815 [Haemaphysalis longicornis]